MSDSPAARYFDGRSGAEHPVVVRYDAAQLTIADATGERARWPMAGIRVSQPDPDGVVSLCCRGEPGRVLVHRAVLPPRLLEGRRGHARSTVWIALAAVTFAAMVTLVRAPWLGATLIPRSVENQLGALTAATLTGLRRTCSGTQGQQALDQLEARLALASGVRGAVQVIVLDDPRINALALPGNRMIILEGLIAQAKNGNELAGVMAHETAHIASRDPVRALVRRYGIRMMAAMFGLDLGFGNLSSMAGAFASLSYGRAMERTADMRASGYLQAAGLRSDGLAAFLEHLEAEKKDAIVPDFLSDHPRTRDRVAWSKGATGGANALTQAQWHAVQSMCASGGAPAPTASAN